MTANARPARRSQLCRSRRGGIESQRRSPGRASDNDRSRASPVLKENPRHRRVREVRGHRRRNESRGTSAECLTSSCPTPPPQADEIQVQARRSQAEIGRRSRTPPVERFGIGIGSPCRNHGTRRGSASGFASANARQSSTVGSDTRVGWSWINNYSKARRRRAAADAERQALLSGLTITPPSEPPLRPPARRGVKDHRGPTCYLRCLHRGAEHDRAAPARARAQLLPQEIRWPSTVVRVSKTSA